MSESDIVQARLLADGSVVRVLPDGSTQPFTGGGTNWQRIREMTDEEAEANALSDPDNPPISKERLKFFRRNVDVAALRQRQGLTQEQFSDRYRIPLGTLRDWEQRRREPDGTAKTLLHLIDKHPAIVLAVLAEEYGESTVSPEHAAAGDALVAGGAASDRRG